MIRAFRYPVRLHSGGITRWMIDCEAFSEEEINVFARLGAYIVGCFGRVEGIPRGGLRLARAMEDYAQPLLCPDTMLVVDDVLTTGRSMREMMEEAREEYAEVKGLVLFARGPLGRNVRCIFQVTRKLWRV